MDARIPPYNAEAEKAILGSILLNNHAFALVQGMISPVDFYLEAHQQIFAVMQDLAQKGTPIDHVTLGSALIQNGRLKQIGGVDALDGLTQTVGTVSNVEYYARLVRQEAQVRRMIYAAQEVVNQGFQRGQEPEEYLDAAEQAIFQAAQQRTTATYASVGTILKETYDHLEEASKRTGDITGVPSGFPQLDRWTAGFQSSDLIIIAGRPAMGKTTFAMNIACTAARLTQKPSLVFSLEMSREQLVRRILASEGRVEAHKLRIPHRLTTEDWRKLTDVSNLLYGVPLFIDDSTPIFPLDIRSRARRLQAERGLGLVVIDYLQLMQAGLKRKESREQEIAEISRSLKGLAKELHVPVIALSQLNRGVEGRSDKRPLMSDLRECVTGDTLVSLADGRQVPVEKLVGQTPEVWSMDAHGRIVQATTEAIWCVGKRSVWEISLASGRKICATAEHRLMRWEGWTCVKDLVVEDRLAIARHLKEKVNSDLFWDRIISIVPIGEELVYDLTVPGTNSWLANSIISHNSGCLEQDADLILFLYRDEVYNKETTDRNIAEVIIGKQRSGPTSTVRLRFSGEYTRFDNLIEEGEQVDYNNSDALPSF